MGAIGIVGAVVCGWAALALLGAERSKRLYRLRMQIVREAEEAAMAQAKRAEPVVVAGIPDGPKRGKTQGK